METTTPNARSTWLQSIFALAGSLLLLSVAGACGGGNQQSGTMNVSWSVELDGCDAAGVEEVEARLNVQNGGGSRTKTFDCTQNEGTIGGLQPANYRVELVGLNADGDVIYTGDTTKTKTVRSAESSSVAEIDLTVKRGELQISWFFDNGRLCGQNDVETIDVKVFGSEFNAEEAAESGIACGDGETSVQDITPGEYRVQLEGNDADGNTTFQGSSDVELGRGQTKEIEVELEQQS